MLKRTYKFIKKNKTISFALATIIFSLTIGLTFSKAINPNISRLDIGGQCQKDDNCPENYICSSKNICIKKTTPSKPQVKEPYCSKTTEEKCDRKGMPCKKTPTGGKCTPPKPKQTDPTNPSPSPSPNLEEPKLIYFRVVGENPCVISPNQHTCEVKVEWKVENVDKVKLVNYTEPIGANPANYNIYTGQTGSNFVSANTIPGKVELYGIQSISQNSLENNYYPLGTIEISGIRMATSNDCQQGRKCTSSTDVCVKTNQGSSICVAKSTACYDEDFNAYYQTGYTKRLDAFWCLRDEAGFKTGQVVDQLICQNGGWINHYLPYNSFPDSCPDNSTCRKYNLPAELNAFLATNCCKKMQETDDWDQYKQYCEDKNQPQEPTATIEKTTFLDWLKNLLSM